MYPWLAHLGSTALDKFENAALTTIGIYMMAESKKILRGFKKTGRSSRAAFDLLKKLISVPRGTDGYLSGSYPRRTQLHSMKAFDPDFICWTNQNRLILGEAKNYRYYR